MARIKLCAATSALAIVVGVGFMPSAAAAEDLASAVAKLQQQLAEQAQRLSAQEQLLAEQKGRIEQQKVEIAQLRTLTDVALATARGAGQLPPQQNASATALPPPASPATAPGAAAPPPIRLAQAAPVMGTPPVGEPPPDQERVIVASVPEGQGVLTPAGHFVVEPQIDYAHGSTNRLVFRGILLVDALQIGLIEASNVDRNSTSVALDVKYGLTERLEIQARLPYVYRYDRALTLVQRDENIARKLNLRGYGLGDVEASVRYQINGGTNGWPIFIGGLRMKTTTGGNPFEVDRDQFGVASELATGSGFWGVEGSLTFLYPTDPAVIFGGVGYFAHLPKNIDRVVADALVGRVDPGDSINANLGFGFALNPRFSFSLGYKHTYVFSTESEIGDTVQNSDSLQVGQFNLGISLAITDRITISNTYSIGATRDAPDMEVVFRVPIRF